MRAGDLHRDVDIATFTGSTRVGRLFTSYPAESEVTRAGSSSEASPRTSSSATRTLAGAPIPTMPPADPLDAASTTGAIMSAAHAVRVAAHLDRAVVQGTEPLAGRAPC